MKVIQKHILAFLALCFMVCSNQDLATAQVLGISPTPLATGSSSAQPNVFLMMDDSQSMQLDYLPDDASVLWYDSSGNPNPTYGYYSIQCNGVYYDPSYIYPLPAKADRTTYAAPVWPNAPYDGYGVGYGDGVPANTMVNLSTSFTVNLDTSQTYAGPAFYYQYSGSQNTPVLQDYSKANSTFLNECTTPLGSPSNVFTRHVITNESAAQQQNFAIWYSFYRTRINMMKSAAGLAFQPFGIGFRVGYGVMNGKTFDPLATFDATGRTNWYSALYSVIPNNSTPLIGALADAGRMYANKKLNHTYTVGGVDTQNVPDPVQYSCQQNFTILSTDGFWNSYDGATKIDGATNPTDVIGEQDDAIQEARPQFDGRGAKTYDVTNTQILQTNLQYQQVTQQELQRTIQYQTQTLTQVPYTLSQYDNTLSYNQFNIISTPYTLTQTQNLLTSTPYTLTQTQNLLTTTPYTLTQTQNLLTVTPYTLTQTPNLLTATPYTLTQTVNLLTATPYTLTQTPQLLTATPYTLTQTPQMLTTTPYTLTQTPQLLTTTPYTLTQTPNLLTSTAYTLTQTPNLLNVTPYTLTQTQNVLSVTPYTLTQTPNVLNVTPYTLTQTQNLLQVTPYTLTQTPNVLNVTPYTLTQTQNLLQVTPYTLTQTPNVLNVTPYTLTQTQNLLNVTPYTLTQTPNLLSYSTFFLNSTPYTLTQTTVPVLSSTGYLQTRIMTDTTWGAWGPASSCTWRQSGATSTSTPWVQCRYVTTSSSNTAAWGTVLPATQPFVDALGSCLAAAASTATTDGSTWTGNATICQYATSSTSPAISTLTGQTSCTQQSPGSLATGTTSNTYTTCAYVAGTMTTGTASCTGVAATKSIAAGANSSYNLCTYSGTGTAVTGQTSCTTGTASGSSPYVSYNTGCTYSGTGTATTGLASCVQQTASGSSPYSSYNTCSYVAGTMLTAQTGCTGSTSPPAAPSVAGTYNSTNLCAYSGTSVTTGLASCTQASASGSNPYSSYNTCAYVAGALTTGNTTCSGVTAAKTIAVGANASYNLCAYSGTGTATTGLATCTQQGPSGSSPYTSYNTCTYVAGTVLTAQTSCSGSAAAPATPSVVNTAYPSTNKCTYSGTGTVTTALSTCTQQGPSVGPSFTSYNTCTYVAGTLQTAQTTCTGSTTAPAAPSVVGTAYPSTNLCAYNGTGTPSTGLATCTQQSASGSSPYASYNTCTYVAATPVTLQTSCTGQTAVKAIAAVGTASASYTLCAYAGTGTPTTGLASCTQQGPSGSSPYASYNTCTYVAGISSALQTTCTGLPLGPPAAPSVVGTTYNSTNVCQYSGTGTATTGLASCTQQGPSGGPVYNSYNLCSYAVGTPLTLQSSCATTTGALNTPPAAPAVVGTTYNSTNMCAYAGTGTVSSGLASCTQGGVSAGPTYSSYNLCTYAAGTAQTNQTNCATTTGALNTAPTAPSVVGTTYNSTNMCAYAGTGTASTGLSTCTQQGPTSASPYASYNLCSYVAGTALTNQTSCATTTGALNTAPTAPSVVNTAYASTNKCAYAGTTVTTGLGSCTQATASTTSPYASYNTCAYVAGTTLTAQTSCSGTTSLPTVVNGVNNFPAPTNNYCVYSGTGTPVTGLSSCVQQTQSVGSPFGSYNTCAYVAGTAQTNQTTCSTTAGALNTAPAAPSATGTYNSTNKCAYSGTAVTTGLGTCTPQTASGSSPFGAYNTCAYVAGTTSAPSSASCTGSTSPPGAATTVGTAYLSTNLCAYSGTATTTGLSSCTVATASATSPYAAYNTCAYVAGTALAGQTSCNGSATGPSAPSAVGTYTTTNNNKCIYSGTAVLGSALSTCAQTSVSAGPSYSAYNTCAYVAGTASTISPTTTAGVITQGTCTGYGTVASFPAIGSSNSSQTLCQYAGSSIAVTGQQQCVSGAAGSIANGSSGTLSTYENGCTYGSPTLVSTGLNSCSVGTANTSSPYAHYTTCSYVAGAAVTNPSTCTAGSPGSLAAGSSNSNYSTCTYGGFSPASLNAYNTAVAISPMLGQVLYNGNYTTDGAAPGSVQSGGAWYIPAASCSVTNNAATSSALNVLCPATDPVTISSAYINPSATCPAQSASPSNNYTSISCANVPTSYFNTPVDPATCTPPGPGFNGTISTACTASTVVTFYYQTSCTPASATALNTWTATTCPYSTRNIYETAIEQTWSPSTYYTKGTQLQDPSGNWYTVQTAYTSGSTFGATDTANTTAGSDTSFPGSFNSLSDTAAYYYAPTRPFTTDSSGNTVFNGIRSSAFGNQYSNNTDNNNQFKGTDLSVCNVGGGGADSNKCSHMSTYTLALGARGKMIFSPTYQTDTSGDFYSVLHGDTITANAANGICSWQQDTATIPGSTLSGGPCNWPLPVPNTPTAVDDLWHAAVDGRGTYFSATNTGLLSQGLKGALFNIASLVDATQAASGLSSPIVTSFSDYQYNSVYRPLKWYGDVYEQTVNLSTGTVPTYSEGDNTTYVWSGMQQLDGQTDSGRTIYAFNAGSSNKLQAFTAANYASNANFSSTLTNSLSQFVTGSSDALPVWTANTTYAVGTLFLHSGSWYKVTATSGYTSLSTWGTTDSNNTQSDSGPSGANLINYIRGNQTYAKTDNTGYYRARAHILGDIVDSVAAYVQAPIQTYADSGFADYQTTMQNRQAMVYVGANDGMLHAFYAATDKIVSSTGLVSSSGDISVTAGNEAWAFIPTPVMGNLYLLADKNYGTVTPWAHQFYVDGSPAVGHICPTAPASNCTGSQWKTILVGGLNNGGRGFYALDITNPYQPIALWEFCNTGCSQNDANLGLSYATPQIVKMADGTWVVIVTSGLNNVSTGDGQGHVYVLNAYTGMLNKSQISSSSTGSQHSTGNISTNTGISSLPSGLARINSQVIDPIANLTVLQVYGGDEQGNLWRFDVNGTLGTTSAQAYAAQLLTTVSYSSSSQTTATLQPIFAKPEIGLCQKKTVVFVGTGRLLGASDMTSTTHQSIYGIMDPLTVTSSPNSLAIYPNPRSSSTLFVNQALTVGTCTAAEAAAKLCLLVDPYTLQPQPVVTQAYPPQPVNYTTQGGWYVDLIQTGETANTDPVLALGTLSVNTNIPSTNSCSGGGSSYNYEFDYCTGGAVPGETTITNGVITGTVAVFLGNGLATSSAVQQLGGGTTGTTISVATGGSPGSTDAGLAGAASFICRLSTGISCSRALIPNLPPTGTHRTSWREIPAP